MSEPEPVEDSFSAPKFCDYIAHEMGNPLNGMLVSAEILERYLQANPRAMDQIGDLPALLKKEIKRLMLLLKELRSSRVLLAVDLQPTFLQEEIRELLALESAYYAQQGIRVDQYVPFGLPRIMADRNRLRQVLLNLCKNAVEAMPNGGTLTLQSYAREERVCLDIADTGEGVPEAMRGFEPGVTDKPNGSGLGLAIVREIVKQHKGRLSYTTQWGKGSTFHLEFPIQAD
jgi:signal transduction histidine kinase